MTRIYLREGKKDKIYGLCGILVNKRFTSVLCVPSSRKITSNLMYRSLGYFKQFMDNEVEIYTNIKDFSLLKLYRYKPSGSIMTREEKALSDLFKKYVAGVKFNLNKMDERKESDDPYIDAIYSITRRMFKFREFKNIKESEAYSFYRRNTL